MAWHQVNSGNLKLQLSKCGRSHQPPGSSCSRHAIPIFCPLQHLMCFSSCCQDDILSFEPDKQAVYQQVYRPVYFQLVDVLLHKAQFPSDEEYGFWSSDEKEQFRIYRCSCESWVCLPGRQRYQQHPATLKVECCEEIRGGFGCRGGMGMS